MGQNLKGQGLQHRYRHRKGWSWVQRQTCHRLLYRKCRQQQVAVCMVYSRHQQ